MKIIGILSLFFPLLLQSQAVLENGDFENWEVELTTVNNVDLEIPTGYWATNHQVTTLATDNPIFLFKETNDVVSGNFAAKIVSGAWGQLPIGGFLGVGSFELNFANQLESYQPGTPFTDRPKRMTGYFKYLPIETTNPQGVSQPDSCDIYCILTKWRPEENKADTIGRAIFNTGDLVEEYTYLDLPFEYSTNESPDTMFTVFTASKNSAPPEFFVGNGSTLYVDDFKFEYTSNTIEKENIDVYAYPNPTKDLLYFSGLSFDLPSLTLEVINLEGKVIEEYFSENIKRGIPVSSLTEGQYFYKLKSDGSIIKTGSFLNIH